MVQGMICLLEQLSKGKLCDGIEEIRGMLCCRDDCLTQLWNLEAEAMPNVTFGSVFRHIFDMTANEPRSALCGKDRRLVTNEASLLMP